MPRHVTDNDKTPLIDVLTLMFMVIAILACIVRSSTKLYMIKALKMDDILAVIATVTTIAQSITVMVSSANGLGKHYDTLSDHKRDNFFKSQYAANLLFILTLVLAKLSGTMSLHSMAQRGQKMIIHGCEIIVGLWGFTAFLVAAFQCQLPLPWNYNNRQCIDRTAFWTYYSVANILTDLMIVGLMVNNVRKIQTTWSKKFLVMGVFGSRILMVPAVAVQIYLSNKAFPKTDYSFAMWETTVIVQLVQMLAIFTVCIPNLKPFLDSLESGQIRIDDLRRQGKSSSNGYPDYKRNYANYAGYKSPMNSALNSKNRTAAESNNDVLGSHNSERSNVHEMVDMPKSRGGRSLAPATQDERPNASWDGQSHTSHSSQTILIQQSWKVDVENTPLPTSPIPGRAM